MRASIAVTAIIAGVASAAPQYGYGGESVVYSTEEVTVTSCGPEVTNCPAKAYSVPTPYSEAAPYSTPAPYSVPAPYTTAAPAYTPAPYSSVGYNVSVPMTTKTIYSTSLITVTSCAEYVTNCPAKSTVVLTSVVPISTTVCPVETPYAEESSSEVYPVSSYAETPCSTSTTVTVTVSPPTTPYATGTGVVPYPPGKSAIWGTASSSGYVAKPSAYPPTFTGAASHANAGMAAVGLGAIAALFL